MCVCMCIYKKNQDCLFNVFFFWSSQFKIFSVFFIVEDFSYYHFLCLVIFVFIYLRKHGAVESVRWSGFEHPSCNSWILWDSVSPSTVIPTQPLLCRWKEIMNTEVFCKLWRIIPRSGPKVHFSQLNLWRRFKRSINYLSSN